MSRATEGAEPGLFKIRLVKGGIWVPAIIYRACPIEFHPETFQAVDRHYHLEAEIDGRPVDIGRIWGYGRRIPIAEYLFMKADRAWVARHGQHLPEADAWKPIDFNTLPPPF